MRQRLLKYVFPVVCLVALTFSQAAAQNKQVSGKVTDAETGEGLPGVNVLEVGTSNGTVTDINGTYSISVGANASLSYSFVGYSLQTAVVGSRAVLDIGLELDVQSLSEVVVVGYGTQDKKELTGATASLSAEDFNRGNVNSPSQLLQGKVPGLSIYNKGGNPNSTATIRLRGISTVGANTEPLVVIDGVIGASLENLDPNDIESISVLKDGSAAAIYGSRGSSGVILVTTKSGAKGKGVTASYNGYVSADVVARQQPVFSASEYTANGGNDLGAVTDWQDEVTRTGVSNVHNLAISGGNETTTFRLSTNLRDVNGVLDKSGFDQINARANINHRALNNKLQINFNMALTNRESNFSFNEALRYAVLYNPTAPIKFDNGDYFQAILFDNFNPVAILEQNVNEGKRKNLNFNAKIDYSITDDLSVTANYAQQYANNLNGEYYSRNSLFRGLNRGGLARRFTSDTKFTLFESYATYAKTFGDLNMSVTGGYSFQEDHYEDFTISMGNFPSDALGYHALETAGDRLSGLASRVDINSNSSPNNRIIAFFGRANFTFDNAIFLNASVRREGSTKLGPNEQWGIFPAVGLGVDINNYMGLSGVDILKLRVGYGVTGSLPSQSGLAQDLYGYSFQGGGQVSLTRDANPDLKWEQKAEINVGVDYGLFGKLSGSLELYTRNISDFILERKVSTDLYPSGTRFENVGSLKTNGIEFSLNYNSIKAGGLTWTPGVVLSSYKTTLESYIEGLETSVRGELGAPGQNSTNMIRVAVGEEIGQIWGPQFSGQVDGEGRPVMVDINGDGQLVTDQGSALQENGDFKQLGSGIPSLEIGWTNQLRYKNWDLNAFFRGAFGHSLVNTFRAFYEPIDPGAINSYNRISTDKAVAGLTSAQFSSLYVEKADFFKLDNITLGYNITTANNDAIGNIRLYTTVQNVFTITNYTGIDPEPVLQDNGPIDNGGFLNTSNPDVLAPGIDRRNNYFTARTFTFGVNIGF
jgi:TonB-dependent starch-binding outer membrane protein SusC